MKVSLTDRRWQHGIAIEVGGVLLVVILPSLSTLARCRVITFPGPVQRVELSCGFHCTSLWLGFQTPHGRWLRWNSSMNLCEGALTFVVMRATLLCSNPQQRYTVSERVISRRGEEKNWDCLGMSNHFRVTLCCCWYVDLRSSTSDRWFHRSPTSDCWGFKCHLLTVPLLHGIFLILKHNQHSL